MKTPGDACQMCLAVGMHTPAVTIRNDEPVCQVCADDVDWRREEAARNLGRTPYNPRGVRRDDAPA